MRLRTAKGKFNNKKVETSEGTFDSTGEWHRWLFLKEAEKAGKICGLRRQVKYTLLPKQYRTEVVHLKTKDKVVQKVAEREVTYTADFVYDKVNERKVASIGGDEVLSTVKETVVEDFKGFPNERWPLKKAMMLYFHGIAVREVKKPSEPI